MTSEREGTRDLLEPKTLSEQLMFVVIRIEAVIGDERLPATAFLYRFEPEGGDPVLAIVTNKHVRAGAEAMSASFHLGKPGAVPERVELTGTTYPVQFDAAIGWIDHPNESVDLCAFPCQRLIDQINTESGFRVIVRPLEKTLLMSDAELEAFSLAEDVLMMGYPNELWDDVHNLPLLRRGMTATHASVDFCGHPEGLIDIAAIRGSSGSPVAFVSEGARVNRKPSPGQAIIEPGDRFVLLGIASHQAVVNVEGEIERRAIPMRRDEHAVTAVPIHLAYYVKAKELLVLERLLIESSRP